MNESSIWEHVAAHVPADGPGLLPGGPALPDDAGAANGAAGGGRLPGEADTVRLLRRAVPQDEATAADVARLIGAAASDRQPDRAYDALHDRLRGSDPLTYLGGVRKRIPNLRLNPERLYDLGRLLVTTSAHRAPVKVGIALFGFFEEGYHVEVLLDLARHDEFTGYAVEAVSRGLDDPEPVVARLAQRATGWGRVAAVRHLTATARRPETLAWMLRHGFRATVGQEYLVLPVATAAGLAPALAAGDVDDDLLEAGVDLIRALLRPGAPEGMDDYADGARATAYVVNLLRSRARSLNHLLAIEDIDNFVVSAGDWQARAERDWTPDGRRALHGVCGEIRAWSWWPARIQAGLQSADPVEFGQAAEAAQATGVDAVPALLSRLGFHGLDAAAWRCLFEQVDENSVGTAVSLATERLPLAEIATGPAGAMLDGDDPRRTAYECLDAVLWGLAAWPTTGWSLVRTGLASPVIRNRNLALRALARWGRPAWPADATRTLEAASRREPEDEVRRRIARLLAGEPLEQAIARR